MYQGGIVVVNGERQDISLVDEYDQDCLGDVRGRDCRFQLFVAFVIIHENVTLVNGGWYCLDLGMRSTSLLVLFIVPRLSWLTYEGGIVLPNVWERGFLLLHRGIMTLIHVRGHDLVFA